MAIHRCCYYYYCKVYGYSTIICAKTAEPIEMPFGLWTRMDPRNQVLDGGPQVPRDVAMATIFVFLYMGCTLALPDEYDWTVRVRRRCGLMSNYFDHIIIIRPHRSTTLLDAAYYYRSSCVICRSVCQSVRVVSPAKSAEPIEMPTLPFGLWARMGPWKHVLYYRVHIGAN